MKSAFTLIEVLVATVIMSIVMVVSIQSVSYVNQVHQQNEIRYLALNRLDSEMSRLVMAYENYYDISANFMSIDTLKIYLSTSKEGIEDNRYGLKIISGNNFVLLNDNTKSIDTINDGDFIGILNWNEINLVSNKEVNLSVTITYPYIYHSDTDYPKLWDNPETLNLQTSTKVK
jgi:prepilin-type N-terminal cleavage/methylation domain-containing protein